MRDGRLQAVDWDEHAAGEVKRSGHADIVTAVTVLPLASWTTFDHGVSTACPTASSPLPR